ncbi:hypothetical protein LOK49_LG13G03038 [Camellia lanceoleosa]|uniref:Uncharacterized protein n=1 Tax=Camellia lanceoleosa TaxID=1840588 RepID=A0ACC0FF03_9ERIC|nr:hypothetical protein LOK49_LG13G03038 [Camellia lanceoleosa]
MAFTPKQFAVIVAALGVMSFIFGVVAEQKKEGKSVPQSAFFSNTKFNIFRNIALATSGFAVSLILYATITRHFLMIRNVHHNLEAECPIAKSGILGGAAFVSLDSSLFWLIVLMLVTNVREDYFDEAKEGDCSKSVPIG